MVISLLATCLLVALPGCCNKKKPVKGQKPMTQQEMMMKKKMMQQQGMRTQIDIDAMDDEYETESLNKF